MLAKLFNNISIQSLIRALFLSVVVLALCWWISNPFVGPFDILSWQWVMGGVLQKLILSAILLFVALFLNSRTNSLGFLKNDYQLIPVMMLMLSPLFFELQSLELALAFCLGIFLLTRLLELVQTVDPSYILFDSGVLLALMVILVPESLFFILLIWIATLNFGHLTVRTFMMPLMGISAMYFMLFTLLHWIFDVNALGTLISEVGSLRPHFEVADFSQWWVYLPLAILVPPAFLETVQVYGKASVRKRQIFTFLMLVMLIALVVGLLVPHPANAWIWLLLPLAVFVVNLIHYLRKSWHKDLVYLMLISYLFLSLLL